MKTPKEYRDEATRDGLTTLIADHGTWCRDCEYGRVPDGNEHLADLILEYLNS